MKKSLKNKIVAITGAGSGIGRAIALTLASEGAKIALCGGNNLRNLDETAKQVKDLGSEVYVLPGNLGDDGFLFAAIEKIHNNFGGLDVLINNVIRIIHSQVLQHPILKYKFPVFHFQFDVS